MPSTLDQLTQAWHNEAEARLRHTLLNRSPRKGRKWRVIVGNEPLRHLSVRAQRTVYDRMPTPARRLLRCNERAAAERLESLLTTHQKDSDGQTNAN